VVLGQVEGAWRGWGWVTPRLGEVRLGWVRLGWVGLGQV